MQRSTESVGGRIRRRFSAPARQSKSASVNQLADDYSAAWLNDAPESLLALYADDAVVIMSLQPAIIGKEALRELYQHAFRYMNSVAENYTSTSNSERKKVEVSGDLGYVWGTYTMTGTPKAGVGGEPIKDHGDTLLIVRRQHDGSWKVALMMSTRSEQSLPASQ